MLMAMLGNLWAATGSRELSRFGAVIMGFWTPADKREQGGELICNRGRDVSNSEPVSFIYSTMIVDDLMDDLIQRVQRCNTLD